MSRGISSVQLQTHPSRVISSARRLKKLSSIKRAFEEFANRNNISSKDWYSVQSQRLDEQTLSILNTQFRGSMYRALSTLFPEKEWCPWKFNHQRVPRDFWQDTCNQRKFFDDFGKQIGISSLDDWYHKLSANILRKNAASVIRIHNGSPQAALMAAYPEHNWIPWKFNNVPTGFWKSMENQKRYFDWLGNELGIKELDDWYSKLTYRVIENSGGVGLIAIYHQSPKAALMAVYPEHHWVDWKFNNASLDNWNSKQNVAQFLAELSEKLSIQTLDDWYRVDQNLLRHFGAMSLVRKYKGLYGMLKQQYPHHPWDPKRFYQKGKKSQRWLVVNLKKLFPNEEIFEDYVHHKAIFPSSNRPMQLDVFIPSRSLGFEYHGKQHYQDIGFFNPTKLYQQRDEEKRMLCVINNIKLIEVPYWWNKRLESLQEMISEKGVM